jgi:putative MATE family efflux protein
MVNVIVLLILDPILALGWGPFPALGVQGAAMAAVLGSMSGVAAQLYVLLRGSAGVTLHVQDLKPDRVMMKRILRIALPTAAQRFSPNLANAFFMRMVSAFGSNVLTAYSVFAQLHGFLQATTMGIGNATATMVGQNLGAGHPPRAERSGFVGGIGATSVSLLLYGLLNLMPEPVLAWFDSSPAVVSAAIVALRFAIVRAMGLGWGQVLGRALGGAGDAVSPMVASLGSLWLVQLPACWLLSAVIGPMGIWAGMALGDLVLAVALTWRFRQGRWKRIEV